MTYWQLIRTVKKINMVEILARLGVTVAQRMHCWRYCAGQSSRSQLQDLLKLAFKWLQLEKLTGPQIVERVVVDHYLWALPNKLQHWVSHREPQMMDYLVEIGGGGYTVVGDLLGPLSPEEPYQHQNKLPALKRARE